VGHAIAADVAVRSRCAHPLVYAVVVLGVLGIGLLANVVPARRAAMVDPMRALHFE